MKRFCCRKCTKCESPFNSGSPWTHSKSSFSSWRHAKNKSKVLKTVIASLHLLLAQESVVFSVFLYTNSNLQHLCYDAFSILMLSTSY